MSRAYAEGTEVPVDRSLSELKAIINRFGATNFAYFESGDEVKVSFEYHELRVLFEMTLPSRSTFRLNSYGQIRGDSAIDKDWQQECRRVWRALTAVVKAKLVAVTEKISTFEQEFLAYVVIPSQGGGWQTVGDAMIPNIAEIAQTGSLPPLMGGPRVIALSAGGDGA